MGLHPNSINTRIFSLFEEHGPMTSGEVARRVGMPLKNVTTRISRLRQMGYLRRMHNTKQRDGSRGQTFYVYAPVTWGATPRVPQTLPIPREWVVERELSEPDRTVYEETGPSPCYYCRHLVECRERVAALDDRPLPCFEGE